MSTRRVFTSGLAIVSAVGTSTGAMAPAAGSPAGGYTAATGGWPARAVSGARAAGNLAAERPEVGRRMLDDMAHPIYHVGLPGELPPQVTVAHKDGDVSGVANDVGVVYGSRPFTLVVLSKDIPDPDAGFADIARVSRIVYDYQERLAR